MSISSCDLELLNTGSDDLGGEWYNDRDGGDAERMADVNLGEDG